MMIQLDNSRSAVPIQILDSPGAFVSWHLELFDGNGDGIAVTWGFGCPSFTTGKPSSPSAARSPASLRVAVFQAGTLVAVAAPTFALAGAQWLNGDEWEFGDSTIRLEFDNDNDGAQHGELHATLNVPLLDNTGALRASIRVYGSIIAPPSAHAHAHPCPSPALRVEHKWTPILAPAFGSARIAIGTARRMVLNGRAYHDRRFATGCLDALGVRSWWRGHMALPKRERVFCVLWPTATAPTAAPSVIGMEIDAHGRMQLCEGLTLHLPHHSHPFLAVRPATMACPSAQWPCIELHERLSPASEAPSPAKQAVWLRAEMRHRLDAGPDSARFFTHGTADEGQLIGTMAGHGTCEITASPTGAGQTEAKACPASVGTAGWPAVVADFHRARLDQLAGQIIWPIAAAPLPPPSTDPSVIDSADELVDGADELGHPNGHFPHGPH